MIREKKTQLYFNLDRYWRNESESFFNPIGYIYHSRSEVERTFNFYTFTEDEYEIVEFQLVENKYV